MEDDLAVAGLAEHTVEDDEVVVGVDVEGGAEAVKEADGSELAVRGCSGAPAPEGGADHPYEDLEYGAGDAHVVVEIGTQALQDGEHPLGLFQEGCSRRSTARRPGTTG